MEGTIRNRGSKIKRILLIGYVGNNNIGDDLMMDETIKSIREYNPDTVIDVLIRYQGCRILPKWECDHLVNIHYCRLAIIKHWVYRHLIVAKYDFVLWVGGTCFGDVGKVAMYKYFLANIDKKIPYGYIGIGIDYCQNPVRRDEVGRLLVNSAVTVFRDETSYKQGQEIALEYAEKNGIDIVYKSVCNMHVADDIVYKSIIRNRILADGNDSNSSKSALDKLNKRLLISWRYQSQYMDSESENRCLNELSGYVKSVRKQYNEIVFLPLDEFLDADVNRRLYETVCRECESETANAINDATDIEKQPKITFIGHMDAIDKAKYIASSDTYICGRLHGMMLADCAKVKLIPINYSLKTLLYLEANGHRDDIVDAGDTTIGNLQKAKKYADESFVYSGDPNACGQKAEINFERISAYL